MLQVNFLRENKERVLEGLKKRNFKELDLVDAAITADDERKKLQFELDSQLSEMNKISKEIGMLMKDGKKQEAEAAKSKTSQYKESSKELESQLKDIEKNLLNILYQLPNIPNEKVVAGVSADDNEIIYESTTVEGLVTYFKEVIEENSVPTYASDEVMELDEYVRNGGKLTDFINAVAEIDYSTLDITDEDNQKRVVTAILREKGWSADKIDKKITRYEDAGVLEDEAEEAIELLKGIATEKKEALLEDQKIKAADAKERQQKFYTDVVNEIKGLSDIRGIKIAKEDRSKLADYLLKPDANGVTQYQKDYSKGGVRNLLESAYFTMKGDVLINSAKSEGNSTAMQKLKNSLKTTGAGKSTRRVNSGTAEPIWVSVAQQLNNK